MANLNTESSNKTNGAVPDFKNKIHNNEIQFEKLAHSAGERVGAMASDFASSSADTMKTSREYVKQNPVKGVAIAAAAGLVAGSLLTTIMRSRKV